MSIAPRFKAFLSHSSKDKAFVTAVASRLGRRRISFDAWVFETGDKFTEAIRKAIAGSDLFVFFVSRESLQSLWVKFEQQEAEELLRLEVLTSSLALIIDPTVKPHDLPKWMQRALITPVVQPARAARLIEAALNKLRGVKDQPLFIGREELLKEFSEKLIPPEGRQPPHLVCVGGLSGVGRKTFLRRGLADFLSLGFGPIFVLQAADDLEMLHLQLLDELGETDSTAEIEAAIERFRKADVGKKADYLAQMLLSAAQGNFAPVIVDEGALLDVNGTYTPEARALVQAIHKYPTLFVAIIHSRRPAHSDMELMSFGALYMRVPPLDLASTKRLLIQSARTASVVLESAQVDDLSAYLDGYPPAVHLAVSMAKDYGVAVLLADKSSLVDFKIHTFGKVLEKLNLKDAEWAILRLLAANAVLPLEAIAVMANLSPEIVAQTLHALIDRNLVLPVGNDFQLAAPIRSAVASLKGVFSQDDQARIAERLKEAYWQGRVPPFEVINATVYAVLRSGGSDKELATFGKFVMPSIMYRVAKEQYDSGGEKGWEAAEQLLTRIIELVPNHRASLILLFKTYVRLNRWKGAEKVLSEIDGFRLTERHYLRGFLAWKKGDLGAAVSHFRNAMAVGHHAVEVYHGLASCLFQLQNLEEAEKVVEKGLAGRRRPNFVLWDLAAQIAILREQYDKAAQIIEELSRLGEDEDYHHRFATLLSARKRFSTALEHARIAASGKRKRFEVLAHLADILIELENFEEARQQIDSLDESYRIGSTRHDVRLGLRCKLFLRKGEWQAAENIWAEIHDRKRPVHLALRAEILRQKIDDLATTPGQRAMAEQELLAMGEQRSLFQVEEAPESEEVLFDEGEAEGEVQTG